VLVYLCFGEAERRGDLEPLGSGQVLVDAELALELQQLLTGERRARTTRLAASQQLVMSRVNCHTTGIRRCGIPPRTAGLRVLQTGSDNLAFLQILACPAH